MGRRGAALLLLAGAVLGAGLKFKDLFDPSRFPLRSYTWQEWDEMDAEWKALKEEREKLEEEAGEKPSEADAKRIAELKAREEEEKRKAKRSKLKAQGVDPAEWENPPPDTEEEKKRKEEKKKKDEEETKKALGRPPPKHPGHRYPGFRFADRLREKQRTFEKMVQPASASKLEGIVKQLHVIDKQADKYGKVVTEAAEEYVKFKEQMDKAVEWQIKKHQKKHGKAPKVVRVPIQLQAKLYRASMRLQKLVAVQQSERQFEEWLVERLAALLNELSVDEVGKPLAALVKGLGARDYRYRVRCVELLGRMVQPPAKEAFETALEKEQDPMVLAEMVRIRAKGGFPRDIVALLARRLDDPRWPVRAAVIAELGRIRHKDAVDVLVKQMAKEKGRLLDDIATVLKDLTRQRYGPEPDPWRIWWEKARDGWSPPPAGAVAGDEEVGVRKGAFVYFYGIQTTSKRIVFCIDFSGSMDFPLDGEDGKEPPRIETAKRELLQALAALPEDAQFNLVVYSSTVSVWKKTMQAATLRNKQLARKYIEKRKPAGATNIYDALNKSLDVAAAGSKAKRKAKDVPVADTIFFLTDGVPTNGRVVDPKQILKEITARNRLLDVVIHTVGVSEDQNAGFLLNLAKQNRGRYVAHK
jgi:Mg-chelatase subunit ChlD